MSSVADPTGQGRNRRRSTRILLARITNAEKRVRRLLRAIPRTGRSKVGLTNNQMVYDYDVPDNLTQSVEFIINQELLDSQNLPQFGWFWEEEIKFPYRQGTAEEINTFNQLLAAAIIAGRFRGRIAPQPIEITQVLFSDIYRRALRNQIVPAFNDIKTLSSRTASQVLGQINRDVQSGLPINRVARNISERFDVAKSSARQIAQTEVNKAYNDAKMETVGIAGQQTGLRSGVIHISALLPTTRPSHAARHGNIYTVEQQTQWWNMGTNRINCHCTVTGILIDKDGKAVDIEQQEELKEER